MIAALRCATCNRLHVDFPLLLCFLRMALPPQYLLQPAYALRGRFNPRSMPASDNG
jgi:hypothetical protein